MFQTLKEQLIKNGQSRDTDINWVYRLLWYQLKSKVIVYARKCLSNCEMPWTLAVCQSLEIYITWPLDFVGTLPSVGILYESDLHN